MQSVSRISSAMLRQRASYIPLKNNWNSCSQIRKFASAPNPPRNQISAAQPIPPASSKEAGLPINIPKKLKLTVKRCPPERAEEVIAHQRRSFYCFEPMNMALGLCQHEESLNGLVDYCRKTVEEGFSMIAVNPDDKVSLE